MNGLGRTLTLLTCLGLCALALPAAPAVAQDFEDDLLDDDLLDDAAPAGGGAKDSGIVVPPPEVKRELDGQIAALAARSEAAGDELFVELAAVQNQNAEIQRRIEEAEDRYRNLSTQIQKLTEAMDKNPATRVQGPRGYGTPLTIGAGHSPMADLRNRSYDPIQPVGQGPSDPNGNQQLKWWEKLLLQLAEGVSELLKVLAEKRTNTLKAEADSIALGTDAKYRPYVDSEVRKAIGTSALGSRLKKSGASNDLLPPKRTATSSTPTGTPAKTPTAANKPAIGAYGGTTRYATGPMPDRYLLPLKRDPLTGEVRPMVSIPLGLQAKRQ